MNNNLKMPVIVNMAIAKHSRGQLADTKKTLRSKHDKENSN